VDWTKFVCEEYDQHTKERIGEGADNLEVKLEVQNEEIKKPR
jgi:hypothetical protein